MDVKTKLKDDKVVFANYESANALSRMIAKLNEKGVYTIEDLINCEKNILPYSSRKTYAACAEIFKHEYLGQELVLDVLLEKEYPIDFEEDYSRPERDDYHLYDSILYKYILEKNYKILTECANDVLKLGFKPLYGGNSMIMCIYNFLYRKKYNGKNISMEYLLKECDSFGCQSLGIRKYYLEYIDKKKKSNEEELNIETVPKVLEILKSQLESLLTVRNELDVQIESLQEQIKSFDKGENSYGRK